MHIDLPLATIYLFWRGEQRSGGKCFPKGEYVMASSMSLLESRGGKNKLDIFHSQSTVALVVKRLQTPFAT